jgi:hypothetical protein
VVLSRWVERHMLSFVLGSFEETFSAETKEHAVVPPLVGNISPEVFVVLAWWREHEWESDVFEHLHKGN